MLRQLRALWVLGWAFLRHVLLAPFRRRRGPQPWLRELAKDNISATPREAWNYLDGTSRCIGCGLCDSAAHDLMAAPPPSEVLMGYDRRPEDAQLVVSEAARLDDLATDIARICPTRVPVQDVARLIRESARELEANQERSSAS